MQHPGNIQSTIDLSGIEIPVELEQFLSIRRTFSPAWSPDDKQIAFITNFERRFNVFTIPSEGGWPHQVTFDGNFKINVDWAFENKIIFTMDNDGDENWQFYLVDKKGDTPLNIVNTPAAQNNFGCFSKDRKLFAFSNNSRDQRYFDCFIHDFETGETRKITERNIICTDRPAAFSNDGSKLLIEHFFNNMDQDILLLDLNTGEEKNLTGSDNDEEDVLFTNSTFVDNDKFVYFISDKDREYKNIGRIELLSGKMEWVVEIDNEIEEMKFSHDQRYMAYTVNRDGDVIPVIVDRTEDRILDIQWPPGVYTNLVFSHSGDRIAFIYSGPTSPADVYVMELSSGKMNQLTISLVGGITKKDLVDPMSIRYESFDGRSIQAFVYLPAGVKKDSSLPCILYPHGGPEYQILRAFSPEFQFFAKHGYAVIVPQFRGSMGFGKSFQKLIYHDWGGGDLKDMIYAVKYLISEGWVNPEKVGVYGGSYGGFATLTCMTKAPDVFACGVDLFGPSNLFTFYESTPANWRPYVDSVLGNPDDDLELFKDRSPINHIDNIKRPLLIMQGANDPRVVAEESRQMYEKLKERGLDVEFVLFKDEGHGFMKRENKMISSAIILHFLDKYLKS